MNAEDAMLIKEMKGKRKRDVGTSSNHNKKKKTQSVGQTTGKKKELLDKKSKFTNFTPLVMPIEQVLMQIRDDPSLQWLKPISTPAERKDKSKYYRFCQDHRHRTDECRHLKDQVETLIWQGKLQKYVRKMELDRYQRKDDKDRNQEVGDSKHPTGEIKTISGGLTASGTLKSLKKAHRREINSIHSWVPPMKMPKNDELDIVFSERDGRGIKQPHDDPLVIMLRVKEFNIHRVLINNRSSADIIYLPTFQQMKLDKKRIRPFTSPLINFTGG